MGEISNKNFGKYIKKKREEKGISREELANKIFVSYEALSKWESGQRIPDLGMIGTLADELGVSVQDIYDHSKVADKEKIVGRIVTSFLILLFIGGCILGLLHNGRGYKNPDILATMDSSEETTETATEETAKEQSTTDSYNATTEEVVYMDMLESAYEVANESQKKKLDELVEEKGHWEAPYYPRAIKQIMGEIPEDMPRMNYEKLMEILEKVDANETYDGAYRVIKKYLDEYAGAPDYIGGSGLYYEVYYFDDSGKEYINIGGGLPIFYHNGDYYTTIGPYSRNEEEKN